MNAFSTEIYKRRRQELKKNIGQGQILLIGNQESGINFKDNWYPFRQDSTMLYYTGIDIPDVHFLMDVDQDKEAIYGNELTIDDIVWTGPLPSLEDYAARAGIEEVRSLDKLPGDIRQEALFLPPYRAEHTLLLSEIVGIQVRDIQAAPSLQLIHAVIGQRNIKEDCEIEEMDKAVRNSYDLHKAVMKASRPGLYEHDLVGVASDAAYKHNVHFAYPAILTKRGEVLHNHDHSGKLDVGDIVLYDGGCESPLHYAGDITRTFPVNGKWRPLQREMYNVVYNSYRASVDALRPGTAFRDIHLLACKTLVEGLKDLGFMKGDVDDAVANGAHTLFFQCGLGHMIGLDVHDMENLGEQYVGYTEDMKKSTEFGLKSLRLGRELEAGFAVTVEPGIYIIPTLIQLRKSQGMYKDFINYDLLEEYRHFGGIRIEDNFIITDEGYHMLGKDDDIPTTSDELEAFMAGD